MNRQTTRLHPRLAARRRATRGMTLFEIMIVLVILGMIAGAIGWNVFGAKKESDIKIAKQEVQRLSEMVDTYRLTKSKDPESLKALETDGLLKQLHNDPWQQPYQLIRNGDNFEVLSYGPNKSQGGGDDISSAKSE